MDKKEKCLAEKYDLKKQEIVRKYEGAAKDRTSISFHQYCRMKWAEEKKIEHVPDESISDAQWQKELEDYQVKMMKQENENMWEKIPDIKDGVRGVKDRIEVRLKMIFGEVIKDNEWNLKPKASLTAENVVFFDLLLRFKTDSLSEVKEYMSNEIKEDMNICDGYWIREVDPAKKALKDVFKEIIVRGLKSLEKNAILGTGATRKLKWVINQYFPEELREKRSCMMDAFEELSDLVQNCENGCSHEVDANRVIYARMEVELRKCIKKLQEEAKHLEFYEDDDENDEDVLEKLRESGEL